MKELKKIILSNEKREEETGVQTNKGPKRLPPSGTGSGLSMSEPSLVHMETVISRGNYIWNAAVSANVAVGVLYEQKNGIVSLYAHR